YNESKEEIQSPSQRRRCSTESLEAQRGGRDAAASRQVLDGVRSSTGDGGVRETSTKKEKLDEKKMTYRSKEDKEDPKVAVLKGILGSLGVEDKALDHIRTEAYKLQREEKKQ
ncbi:hypothetical protein HID58_023339, partial [Brassica napus]